MRRSRLLLATVCLGLIAAGLASRSGLAEAGPRWLVRHAGDALWAANLYFVLGLLRPSAARRSLLLATVLLCFAVECSQLLQPEWLESLRRTRLGALVLGHGFLWIDWLRYAVGALLALALDAALWRGRRR